MAQLTPSHRCLLAVTAAVAGADVWLVRRDHQTMSTLIRRNRYARPLVVYMAAHLLFDLPFDPLHQVHRMVDRRRI